jgi:hypothetical protein
MFYTRINKIKVERAVSTIINNDARPCKAFQIVDVQNPALQAVVDGGTLSACCASLACGYEYLTFQVSYYIYTKKQQIEMHPFSFECMTKFPTGKNFRSTTQSKVV